VRGRSFVTLAECTEDRMTLSSIDRMFLVEHQPLGWGPVARMARISVRSGSLKRSVAGWIPLNHAV